MTTEKKIFLDRNDTLEIAVNRLIKANAHLVVLNIPRDSLLSESLENFHILKRESVSARKELLVESIDERVLELAGLAQIGAVNPIFRREERVISDILPKPRFSKKETKKDPEPIPAIEEKIPVIPSFSRPRPKLIKSRGSFGKKIAVFLVIFLLFGGGFFLVNNILPRVTIAITLKKFPTPFAENIEVSSAITEVKTTVSLLSIPGEFLTARRNQNLEFAASGEEEVERSAKAKLTVVNAYDSLPQVLVARTRFLSPQGKIFRLDQKVTVPGAKVQNGKIVPSEIEVAVTADKPGEDYNLPASPEKWRIPGFEGTPRYEGFYAFSLTPPSGGVIGKTKVATAEDIQKGKEVLRNSLSESLKSEMLILFSSDLKLFEEAEDFKIIREEVGFADEDGKFDIFMEAELRYLVFREEILKEVIAKKIASTTLGELQVKDFSVTYSRKNTDFNQKRMSFQAEGVITFESKLALEQLRADLYGENEEELRRIVFFLPGLERANVKLWPFWVSKVPSTPRRLEIKID